MMNEEKNMDKIFRDKLEGFQMDPPPLLWDGIRETLLMQRRAKRVALYRWAAVAAMLAIAFFGGWYFNKTVEKDVPELAEQVIVYPERNNADENARVDIIEKSLTAKSETIDESDVSGNTTEKSAGLVESPRQKESLGGIPDPELQSPTDKYSVAPIKSQQAQSVLREEPVALKGKNKSEKSSFSDAEKRLIAENIRHKRDYSKNGSSWKMGMNVSPGYSSYSASHERDYANNMTYSATDGNSNVSAGISVQYKTKGRWSVESGVYYVQNGQKSESIPQLFAAYAADDEKTPPFTEGLYVNTDIDAEGNRMVMNSVAGIVEFESLPEGAEIEASLERAGSYSNALVTRGEFSQVFDFVEIHLFLRYLLVDSRVGLEVAGGINAGLVVGNNAYINNDYGLQNIGKTRDISAVNFSASIGMGVTYSLSKHISLAIEPRMNYYINSINRNPDVNFRPYRIGLYSGLYYEF